MDALDLFESPRLLIDGAEEGIDKFEAGCKAFIEASRYNVVQHIDPNTRENVLTLRFEDRLPGALRREAHHIVCDLRHALDQAMCDASLICGRSNADGVQFPLCKNASELSGQMKRVCRDVHTDLLDFVASMKPYCGGNNDLWGLGRMASPNKHQRILGLAQQSNGMEISGPLLKGPATLNINKWNDARNELEFARVGPGGHLKMQIDFAIQVVIQKADVFAGQPASTVFRKLLIVVNGVAVGLEAEARRIAASPLT